MTTVRFGILGFGLHAARRLMPAFARTEHSTVSGIWRRDAAKAQANAAAWKIARVFSTPEELCASADVDAVFIASPDALHLEHTLLAMAHGKPVLCEKPMAMNAAEAQRMAEASRAAGTRLCIGQNFRFNRSVELMRDWVRAGRIGKAQLAQAQFTYPAKTSQRAWIADPGMACGGPIADVGVHCIDALRYILGEEVLSVDTLARKDTESDAVEAVASLQLAMSGDVCAQVMTSARAPYRTSLEVTGSTGTIVADNGFTVDRPVDVTLRAGGEVLESVRVDNGDGYTRMLDCFVRALTGECVFPASGEDGAQNMRILDAAYRSWRSGLREAVSLIQ